MYNFSGFFFCIGHFRKPGIAKAFDNTLGIRSNLAKYSYYYIFESMMAICLAGGSRIEDTKRLSAQFSEKSQGYRLCSPDTILKTLSDKAEEDSFVGLDPVDICTVGLDLQSLVVERLLTR